MSQEAQVIHAPSREPIRAGNKTVFLAGTAVRTAGAKDWRTALTEALAHVPELTILDPYRPDWDAGWREDESFAPFRDQVEWELDMQARADLVAVYLYPGTQAHVSLLELGLAVGSGNGDSDGSDGVVVCCPEGYWKRGNVSIVCRRFGVEMVEGGTAPLRDAIIRKLGLRLDAEAAK